MSDDKTPSVRMVIQYVKDLSVENPAPFEILQGNEDDIETNFSVDTQAQPLEKTFFEIELIVKASIQKPDAKGFLLELNYTGIFEITDAKEEVLPLVVFVQCPHLLFPSVRHIIRTMAQESGFPGFNVQMVDFLELFRKKIDKEREKE